VRELLFKDSEAPHRLVGDRFCDVKLRRKLFFNRFPYYKSEAFKAYSEDGAFK